MVSGNAADFEMTLASLTSPSAPELTRRLPDGRIECLACGHACRIGEGHRGVCRVRFVRSGELRRPAGYVAALACDPIEKKPFYHAFPGRDALTFGMLGCDLKCPYCQNWSSSQTLRDEASRWESVVPCRAEQIVRAALDGGAPVVTSSYNEPLITADWAVEVLREAHRHGLAGAFVSNGNASAEVLEYLRPWVSLYKVDLKGFRQDAYRELGGRLSVVTDTIRRLRSLDYWVEIVTLLVPGFNDDDGELRELTSFLAEVDPLMPWHVTAFHPDYRMVDRTRTTAAALRRAAEIAGESGLRYVYAGNASGEVGRLEDTRCHECGATLIRRHGFRILENRMQGGSCPDCATDIPGVWENAPPRGPRGDHASRPPSP